MATKAEYEMTKKKHNTGWTSVVYGDERWHRTYLAAYRRACTGGHSGEGEGVWCVTGMRPERCECPQCRAQAPLDIWRLVAIRTQEL